ncbi:MAG: Ferric uptake regulation protein [Candidatus Kaiserbacteria bacterium GW2011_GWA2_49_19]|uniref:Ferric uptake regulation protein n=1 Tax=Candidatus Kaiserbacteria bacterium GW2011_GWA2_49_19 TaxID=1618669 RepID=A0A0G1VSG0_9BACT|nr:MAG: Ferric uptake regulation protein [Candidatus Kaiserbacteria bacterium GW2011_GWA2_49_19]
MKKSLQNKDHTKNIIQKAGFRATKPRLALLSLLQVAKYPLNIKEIMGKLETATADQVTVYRILDAFKKAGIVNQINFQDNATRYEYKDTEHDHHHIVCVTCKKVEDFIGCDYKKLAGEVLKQTPCFAEITDHSFEFFGKCKTCVSV